MGIFEIYQYFTLKIKLISFNRTKLKLTIILSLKLVY